MDPTNQLPVKQAAVLDLLRNGADIGTAAKAAGVAVRTVHDWAAKNTEFAALKSDAMLNRGRTVTEGQLSAWQQELDGLRAAVDQIQADLLEQAAPALAGNADAQERQAELREQQRQTDEQIAALTLAIQSAAQHLARAREQEAQAAREAAAAEADTHSEAQRAAAAKVDAALVALGEGWAEFVEAARQKQSAARKAGARTRAAYSTNLVQAVWASCLPVGDALELNRTLRVRARTLSETVK